MDLKPPVDYQALALAIVIPVLMLVCGLLIVCVLLVCARRCCTNQHPMMQLHGNTVAIGMYSHTILCIHSAENITSTLKRGIKSIRYIRKPPKQMPATNPTFLSVHQPENNTIYSQLENRGASQIVTKANMAYHSRDTVSNPDSADSDYQRLVHTDNGSHGNKNGASMERDRPEYDYPKESAVTREKDGHTRQPVLQRPRSQGGRISSGEQHYDYPLLTEQIHAEYHLMSNRSDTT